MIIQETIPILRKYTLKYLEIKGHDFVTYHLKVQKVCMPVCTYIYICVCIQTGENCCFTVPFPQIKKCVMLNS